MRKALIVGTVALCVSVSAHAENAACWGDDSRGDISCTKITEKLLMGFRGQTVDAIRKAMKAPGRGDDNALHFLSNYSRGETVGSGDVNVAFENGKATSVSASVDQPKGGDLEFIWSAYAAPALGDEIDRSTTNFGREPLCSDFSGKPGKCSTESGTDAELTKMQMEGNLSKSDLLKGLEASCNPGGGLVVSDPAGDCARLHERLAP